MARKEKLKDRLFSRPRDFTWNELKTLLRKYGFEELTRGTTGGSRRKFYHSGSEVLISLHEPHPGNELKLYAVDEVIAKLGEHITLTVDDQDER